MSERLKGSRPKGAGFGIALNSSVMVIRSLFQNRLGLVLPLVIVLLVLALVLALCALVSPLSPFIYPLF